MAEDLEALRDSLSLSLEELLVERDAAFEKKDMAKVTTAEAEADRIGVILATVQFAINEQQAMNMNAVAARLQESIEAQRAVGLSSAVKTLEKLLKQVGPAPLGEGTTGKKKGKKPPSEASAADIRARPGKHQVVVDKLIAGAEAHGLDPMTVLTFIAIESDFDPTATSPVSSAAGLFQFIDSTWKGAGGPTFPGRGGKGNGHAAGAPVDLQIEIGCTFVANNFKQLAAKLGRPPTVMALYMAHQQGLTGALKILSADRNAAIESVIGEDAARNNAFGGLTVGQTIEKFNAVVRSNEDEARALVVTIAAPAGEGEVAEEEPQASILPKAISIALNELEMFARRDGTVLRETQDPLRARVLEYFRLVGRPDIVNPASVPWSAAFISFVLNSAGAAPTQFPISPSHARYILIGLANRIANRFNAPIVYFDRHERAPQVGDLIGFSRTAQVTDRADMEEFLPDRHFDSHTNLVIAVSPGKLKCIGGNLSQTIQTKTVKTDAAGKIDPSDEHFFVLQMNM